MVALLGGEVSVGLRAYCRSYYYLQFTLRMNSESLQIHTFDLSYIMIIVLVTHQPLTHSMPSLVLKYGGVYSAHLMDTIIIARMC